MALDIAELLVNLSASYEPIVHLITGSAYVMGMAFGMIGVYKLKVYGDSRTMMSQSTSLKGPIMYLLTSAVFLYLPTAIDTLMLTLYGNTGTPLSYGSPDDDLVPDEVIFAAVRLVQIIGLIAFIRGWLLLAQSSKQGAQPMTGKAMVHIFGGILAINILGTKDIISGTFGINF